MAGDAIISDCATGDDNEMVIADDASENLIGMALETAGDLETFKFLLQPIARKIA